jgi:hypothetical protein
MATPMHFVDTDRVIAVERGTTPDYDAQNSLLDLVDAVEWVELAASHEYYLAEHLQYLFPFRNLSLYGPSGDDQQNLDPRQQDNKQDFQKQNVQGFLLTDTYLLRGWAVVGDWTGPFLQLSYRGGPDSLLSRAAQHRLGDRIRAWVRVGDAPPATLTVPYNPITDRYEIELWGYPGDDLAARLEGKGHAAFERGGIVARPDLVRGDASAFARPGVDGKPVHDLAPEHAMHPIRPLHVEVAWADLDEQVWDSRDGANYHYEFNMVVRGWDHYLAVGDSANPHGGVGSLEYRTLMSNYGPHSALKELGRTLSPWSFDAFGRKDGGDPRHESFFAVDYMDLHILRPHTGIGLHRHRDNQEVFLMMEGRGLMVVGDWYKMPTRERCFELRTLRAGHFAMLKGGNLHGLLNPTDEMISLFMFGGYD